jgi:hypothetical protein
MRSTSSAASPAFCSAARAERRRRLVGGSDMALADAGALHDPLVGGLHDPFEVGVLHDAAWQGRADTAHD